MTKKYLIKYKHYAYSTQVSGMYVDKVTIMDLDPLNLSDDYVNFRLNEGNLKTELSYYYDIIPLS